MLDLIGFFITIGILVTFHEYGHFFFARLFGIHVSRFSVGFGKPIKTWTSKKHVTELGATQYAIAAIPLGGFVQMAERPREDQTELHASKAESVLTGAANNSEESIPAGLAFQDKPAWQRALVVAAGPIANFALAIVLFSAVYVVGNPTMQPVLGGEHQDFIVKEVDGSDVNKLPDLMLALATSQNQIDITGYYSDNQTPVTFSRENIAPRAENPLDKYGLQLWRPSILPIIGRIMSDTPAAEAGLQAGDTLISINNQPIELWGEISAALNSAEAGSSLPVVIERDNQMIELSITPSYLTENGTTRPILGIQPDPNHLINPEAVADYQFVERLNPIAALQQGTLDTWNFTATTFTVLSQMLVGQQSIKNLGGPLTIADAAGSSLASGIKPFLIFLAIISLSLGFLNLLPIPVLDGGHLLIIAIESIIGRPIHAATLSWFYKIGLFLVLGITVIALGNDVLRFIN